MALAYISSKTIAVQLIDAKPDNIWLVVFHPLIVAPVMAARNSINGPARIIV